MVRAYLLYQRIMENPHLLNATRQKLLEALTERGKLTDRELEAKVRALLEREAVPVTEDSLARYKAGLLDLVAVTSLSDSEIEEYVNLTRKEDLFVKLVEVLNSDNITYREIKQALRNLCTVPQGTMHISSSDAEGVRVALLNHFVSNQLPFIGVAKKHITIRDVDSIVGRTVWNPRYHGLIGGKAAGMYLAYRILIPRLEPADPELGKYVAIPDTYFFSSGIFQDFIEKNGLVRFHLHKYESREKIEEKYRTITSLLENADFPSDVEDQFREFLEKAGESPLVVRSSSHLEDNFGHAFSGKYESVFLTNQGSPDERLAAFIKALKRVHGSTLAPNPILYRRDHHLLDFDERMGLLVQKVVGGRYGDYFFPTAAGVAFSHNSYNWTPKIRREDGLVRIVYGLGTRAVDLLDNDYVRMAPLSHPLLRPEIGAEQITRYSQRKVDVINLRKGGLETIPFTDLCRNVQAPDLRDVVSLRQDSELTAPLYPLKQIDPAHAVITFENLLRKGPFAGLMKRVLARLEEAYGQPVDMEFAWHENKLYILQCRPLLVTEKHGEVQIPADIPKELVLFTSDRFVSNDIIHDIEYLVYVDPRQYARLESSEDMLAVGRVVSRLNTILEHRRFALFGPGRWGSNDITLGVRVRYGDINHTRVLAEIAFEDEESAVEVSYGTHFLIDLMEANITPVAIFANNPGAVFREEFFLGSENFLTTLDPALAPYSHVVRVIHTPSASQGRLLQVYQDGARQRSMGFLAHAEE